MSDAVQDESAALTQGKRDGSRPAALDDLLALGQVAVPPDCDIRIIGSDPVADTRFRVGEAAAIALAAQGAAIAALWKLRTPRPQTVTVDVTEAALSLKCVLHLRQNGYSVPLPDPAYPTVDAYPTYDNRYFMLHGGYPALRDGILALLGCANTADAVRTAMKQRESQPLEDEIAERGLCGAIVRTAEEWREHPQGRALARLPLIDIQRIGDSPPEMPTPVDPQSPGGAVAMFGEWPLFSLRPLSGLRVLDLTHVLAGPTSTRVLAEQGADVLRISAPQRPVIPSFVMDTGHGKLSTLLDLKDPDDAERMRELVRTADVIADSYRPGALERLGFSAQAAAKLRPGIIYLSVSCYGHEGPWRNRPGWEQLAQMVTGMALEEGAAHNVNQPRLNPLYPNDYITGYLAAYGVLAALLRRARDGGSYHVRVALCRTAMWIQSLGRATGTPPSPEVLLRTLNRTMEGAGTPWGDLTFMGPVTRFSETPARWERPSAPLAAHQPAWPNHHRFTTLPQPKPARHHSHIC